MPASRTHLTDPMVATRRGVLLATIGMISAPAKTSARNIVPRLLHAADRYFATPDGKAVFLAGSHTWNNGQDVVDSGGTDAGSIGTHDLDFIAYVNWLSRNNMNFIRFWRAEGSLNTTWSPDPWPVVNGKYNLHAFDQSYYDRLLSRVQVAAANDIYVSVMLFNGWSYTKKGNTNSWPMNAFNVANNSNGINGDPNNTGQGLDCMTGVIPAVAAIQKAYIRKVCDTLSGQTNVLFEVCNECEDTDACWAWQSSVAKYLKTYAASKGYPAWPVGITAAWPTVSEDAQNTRLFTNTQAADWVSPSGVSGAYKGSSPVAPSNKVILIDSDHIYGIGGDHRWVWRQFMQGYGGVLYMDNLRNAGISGTWHPNDSAHDAVEASGRLGMMQTRVVASRVNLASMVPSASLSSTGYCLANPSVGEYVVLADKGDVVTVNLSGASGRSLQAEWLDLGTGRFSSVSTISGTSRRQVFTSPYSAGALIVSSEWRGGQSRHEPGR